MSDSSNRVLFSGISAVMGTRVSTAWAAVWTPRLVPRNFFFFCFVPSSPPEMSKSAGAGPFLNAASPSDSE